MHQPANGVIWCWQCTEGGIFDIHNKPLHKNQGRSRCKQYSPLKAIVVFNFSCCIFSRYYRISWSQSPLNNPMVQSLSRCYTLVILCIEWTMTGMTVDIFGAHTHRLIRGGWWWGGNLGRWEMLSRRQKKSSGGVKVDYHHSNFQHFWWQANYTAGNTTKDV